LLARLQRRTACIAVVAPSKCAYYSIMVRYNVFCIKHLQISFQEFKNKLLEPGLVDRIVVSNKSVAKVYIRNSPHPKSQGQDSDIHITTTDAPGKPAPSRCKYYFNIGSVDLFEEKLEEAQEALGIDPHDFVPVTYVAEVNWFQEVMRFAPTALIVGLLYFTGKRMQSGFNIGGGAGKGRGGIFNIGKATVMKMDKNSKNKVCYYFSYVTQCLTWFYI
jgi:AFG3 family protein